MCYELIFSSVYGTSYVPKTSSSKIINEIRRINYVSGAIDKNIILKHEWILFSYFQNNIILVIRHVLGSVQEHNLVFLVFCDFTNCCLLCVNACTYANMDILPVIAAVYISGFIKTKLHVHYKPISARMCLPVWCLKYKYPLRNKPAQMVYVCVHFKQPILYYFCTISNSCILVIDL